MDLLYEVIYEYVEDIIRKKKDNIKEIIDEYDLEYNSFKNGQVDNLLQDIETLNKCRNRLKVLLEFIDKF